MELQSNADTAVENKRRVCLFWEDLTVVASNGSNSAEKELLKGLSGYAEPNRIMALIGPSGSGKSTLLAALAGSSHTFLSFLLFYSTRHSSPILLLNYTLILSTYFNKFLHKYF